MTEKPTVTVIEYTAKFRYESAQIEFKMVRFGIVFNNLVCYNDRAT